jgi:ketol-acid reductoisomerase
VARKKLYEMNQCRYGRIWLLFDHACKPVIDCMKTIDTNVIGKPFSVTNSVENSVLITVNKSIRQHPIEELRVVERINDCNEENRIDLKGDYHR